MDFDSISNYINSQHSFKTTAKSGLTYILFPMKVLVFLTQADNPTSNSQTRTVITKLFIVIVKTKTINFTIIQKIKILKQKTM